jgi:hypothetical protein
MEEETKQAKSTTHWCCLCLFVEALKEIVL